MRDFGVAKTSSGFAALVSSIEPVLDRITLASNGSATVALQAGTVLGKVTASGKYVPVAPAASDGSQTPDLILADDVDATAGDVVGGAYSRGDFNANALKLGAGHTVASIRDGLRSKGIIVVSAIPA